MTNIYIRFYGCSLPDLETEVRRLGKEMKEIEKEILYQRNHKTGHPDDRFIQVMSDFITVAGYKYSELHDKFNEMQERVRERQLYNNNNNIIVIIQ